MKLRKRFPTFQRKYLKDRIILQYWIIYSSKLNVHVFKNCYIPNIYNMNYILKTKIILQESVDCRVAMYGSFPTQWQKKVKCNNNHKQSRHCCIVFDQLCFIFQSSVGSESTFYRLAKTSEPLCPCFLVGFLIQRRHCEWFSYSSSYFYVALLFPL